MNETSIKEYSFIATFLVGNIFTVELPIRSLLATDEDDAKQQAIAFFLDCKMGKLVYSLKQDKMIYIDGFNNARMISRMDGLSLNTIEEESQENLTYHEWKKRILNELHEDVMERNLIFEVINFRIEQVNE
ncbi:hypothetical protein [Alkalibacillus haloalkaliphilus]|uniref:Uncharacterized protein n=1 Tax=Alkalibacillus haloalkaliphilus TaxID=94136 RepID=A0A511WBW0_9BACI|nr:hypothetical protein [Alkalibacillus haloalkaliphilus]GEN46752.1 hypothetical protein AHA02nite_25280 [Alkalibacillus haloalkaliphilus]